MTLCYREPRICFPSTIPECEEPASSEREGVLKKKKELKGELSLIDGKITEKKKSLQKYMKKFRNKKTKYNKILDDLRALSVGYNSAIVEEDTSMTTADTKPGQEETVATPENHARPARKIKSAHLSDDYIYM